MPERIQRKRTRGWKMPEGAVYVGRPTLYGNVFREGQELQWDMQPWVHKAAKKYGIRLLKPLTKEEAVLMFRAYMEVNKSAGFGKFIREQLRGKDLCCWCPLDAPCHADILLELANR